MGRSTFRPQNVCGSCNYSWHPRGKMVSARCPSCGSSDTRIVSPPLAIPPVGFGCLGLVVVAGVIILGVANRGVAPDQARKAVTQTTASGSPTPVADATNRPASDPVRSTPPPTLRPEPPVPATTPPPDPVPPEIPVAPPPARPTHTVAGVDGAAVPLATTSGGLDQFVAAVANGNTAAVESMISRGLAYQAAKPVQVRLSERGVRISYVTPVGGPWAGKILAVESKYLRPIANDPE